MNNWLSVVFPGPWFHILLLWWRSTICRSSVLHFPRASQPHRVWWAPAADRVLGTACAVCYISSVCQAQAFKVSQKTLVKCRSFVFCYFPPTFLFYLRLAEALQSWTHFLSAKRNQRRFFKTYSCVEMLFFCVCKLLKLSDSHSDPSVPLWFAISEASDVAVYTVFQAHWAHCLVFSLCK